MRGLLINISSSLFNIFGFTNNQSVLPIHSRMSVCKFYKLRIKQRWSCVRRLSVFSEHQLQHSVSCFILVRVHMFTGPVLCACVSVTNVRNGSRRALRSVTSLCCHEWLSFSDLSYACIMLRLRLQCVSLCAFGSMRA
jgi:hypothetical protein